MTADRSEPHTGDLLHQIAWVRRLALALVRDPVLADDLAQQAASSWVKQRPTWARRGSGLRTWLARAVRSLVVDHHRAERSRRQREVAVAEVAAAHADASAAEVVVRHEQQQRIAAAVHALAEPYRTTILYRFLDELPAAAVAERMGVPEATVRKRIERGLAMLRTRLDTEFGANARGVCVGLLAPGLQREIAAGTLRDTMFLGGIGIMGSKVLAGVGALAAVAAAAVWLWTGARDAGAPVAAGGRGEVVPANVAMAREQAMRTAAGSGQAAPADASRPTPEAVPRVHGFVFVDGVHRAPSDLTIETSETNPSLQLDVGAATWSYAVGSTLGTANDTRLRQLAPTLWITSSSTVPAQVPIPAELVDRGGVFDLHLASGRTLALRFLDEQTRAPMAGLEFEVGIALELTRSKGRTESRSSTSRRRTDESGRAVVHGLPDRGAVSVRVDFAPRERQLLMRDGSTLQVRWPAQPVWSQQLDPSLPRQLEATILAATPLGEAVAKGQVPAWAMAAGQGLESVRVIVRERAKVGTDASGLGERYLLPVDAQGTFTLAAGAPSRHVVWLQRTADGTALSALAEVCFERAGPQPSIAFVPLVGFTLSLRCHNVPAKGTLEISDAGAASTRQRQHACAGQPFAIDLPVVAGTTLHLRLVTGDGTDGKSGWMRQLAVTADMPRELALDLAGSARRVELRAEGFDFADVRAIVLLPCRAGAVVADERVVAMCEAGRSLSAVHVAPGRWLFGGESDATLGLWGVVDVPAGASGPLVLAPRLHRVPADELRPACRLDAIDGVALTGLPERLRTVRVPGDATRVVVPLGAQYVRLRQ